MSDEQQVTMSSDVADVGNAADTVYEAFLARVQARLDAVLAAGSGLFETDADCADLTHTTGRLFAAYLEAFPEADRQYHNCQCCRHFIERYGGLVTIDEAGRTTPVFWDERDAPYPDESEAIGVMARRVRRAKVTGPFHSSEKVWGRPLTGCWRHLAVVPPPAIVFARRKLSTPEQAMAEKREDYKTVSRALGEYPRAVVDQALTLLETDALYRSEKVLGPAKWLHDLHLARAAAAGHDGKANVLWRAVAAAPQGFCHPRSSMVGTLLDDIAAGMEFGEVSRRFAAKMHPLQYQRPQAPPAAGAIAQAEKLFAEMGLARSLERRFARLDEVEAVWKPAPPAAPVKADSVFGHLQPKGAAAAPSMQVPPVVMTWEKFSRTVLPTAERIELLAPAVGPFSSLVTAVHADAPPLLQWDRDVRRNPVSWYFWNGGSRASQFGLDEGRYYRLNAITLQPSMWGEGSFPHQGEAVMFIVDGAKDRKDPSLALFPEILKSELHGVRSVIEAHSRSAKMAGADQASAAGLMLRKGSAWDLRLRVSAGARAIDYKLDRWD